jgi:protein TonB
VDVPPSIPPLIPGPAFTVSALRRALEPGALLRVAPGSGGGDRIRAVGEVDEPASVLLQPAPRYPPVLQAAGLEGRVLLEFVIDTAGHPEPASLRIIERSREGFDAAALETLERSLFRPARVGGRTVRQRTLQWVVFRIAPS